MMSVNNETGAIMPLDIVAPAIKKANAPALFHVDNVQGFGKINLNVKKLGCDLMSISGHKLHAPKGIGALYLNKKEGKKMKKLIINGQRELSGTIKIGGAIALGLIFMTSIIRLVRSALNIVKEKKSR